MPYDLLVEISDDLDAEQRDRLLSLAYRASRSHEVALVLRGVSRAAVDRTLDPIVEREGTALSGVRYLEPDEVRPLLEQNGIRECVIVSPHADWLSANGDAPRVRSPGEAIVFLEGRLSPNGAA